MDVNLITERETTIGGTVVGRIAFGCWRLVGSDVAAATEVIETALDSGLNLIDTADVYGLDWGGSGFGENEAFLGKVLASSPALRDRMVLATKGGILPPTPYDSSKRYLEEACEASLTRLGVETIDLYQVHRPDVFTHPGELAATLSNLVEEGKVRNVGVSNYTPDQTRTLLRYLDIPLVTTQPQFSAHTLNPMYDGTFDLCMQADIVPLAWSPLEGGALAAGHGGPDGPRPELVATLDRLADREGVDRASLALGFVLAHPAHVIPIIGTQNPDRIRGALAALDITLTRNDVYDIIEASQGEPLP